MRVRRIASIFPEIAVGRILEGCGFAVTRLLPLSAAMAICGLAYLAGTLTRTRSMEEPGLCVDKASLHLGDLWERQPFSWKITLVNRSQRPVLIEHFSSTCTCVAVSPSSAELSPGDSVELHLVLNVAAGSKGSEEPPNRTFRVTLYPHFRGIPPRHVDEITLTGRLRDELLFHSNAIEFGEVILGQSERSSESLTIHAKGNVRHIAASTDCPWLRASVIRDSQAYRLQVGLIGDPPLGRFTETVTLSVVVEGDVGLPGIPIKVSGTVLYPVQCVPAAVRLGARPLHEEIATEITVRGPSGITFMVEDVDVLGHGVTVSRTEAAAFTYAVRQQITTLGNCEGEIRFRVRTDDDRFVVKVPVSYYGIR